MVEPQALTHLKCNSHCSKCRLCKEEVTKTGIQRDIIRKAVNASEHDAVIFSGTGCTSAVSKLIHALNLKKSVVVFVSPFEHHSNLLPWREINAKIVRIKETINGLIDLHHLETELKRYSDSKFSLIGSFSAASNITGILTDDKAISILLHKYEALSFWDYAAAAPYVHIDMNPIVMGLNEGMAYKDAVFISPHKFVGGPDTPGILIAKKSLLQNPIPSEPGGGTIFFVSRETHRYLKDEEMREEGGTPSIVGAIRAGMAFQLKEAIGTEIIAVREEQIFKMVLNKWEKYS
ncbi:probable cysteine desulfurase [Trichonephila clavipes]|nr:probable cysteine desulfurase [Trichonephila clavipes]